MVFARIIYFILYYFIFNHFLNPIITPHELKDCCLHWGLYTCSLICFVKKSRQPCCEWAIFPYNMSEVAHKCKPKFTLSDDAVLGIRSPADKTLMICTMTDVTWSYSCGSNTKSSQLIIPPLSVVKVP